MSDNAVVIPMTKKAPGEAPKGPPPKDLYELGEIPPLGHVPAKFAMEIAIDKAKQSGMAITE